MSIFGDNDGIFDDDDVEEGNTLRSAAQERALEPRVSAPPARKRKVKLVAKFADDSTPLVARVDAATDEMLEAWRRPSRREVEALQRAGRLVKGGFIDEAPPLQAQALGEGSVTVNWKKLGICLGALAGVCGLGYVGYRVYQGRKADDSEE